MKVYDACVVGVGGIVGSAIIRDLSQRGLAVIGVEKHDGPAQETSGLNSRVIHSGFHETPGTLKARLALHGSRMLMDYAAARGVSLLHTGMLIAVPKNAMQMGLWRELRTLWHLWRGGRRHHVAFKWILSANGIRRIAPIEAIGGIFIPSVCVVDVMQLITSLQRDALEHGADIRYGQAVQDIARDGIERYMITTSNGAFASRSLVNSAGLSAPFISRMAGGPDYTIERIRGEYYELRGGMDRWKIRTLVYPASPSKSRSKGIHFGPRTDGRLFIGPDAADLESPPTPKSVFLQAAQKYLPSITDSDLEHSCTGVRPKYVLPDGTSDFLIRVEESGPPLVNLIGIDSPGLSASMAIAEHAGTILINALRPSPVLKAA